MIIISCDFVNMDDRKLQFKGIYLDVDVATDPLIEIQLIVTSSGHLAMQLFQFSPYLSKFLVKPTKARPGDAFQRYSISYYFEHIEEVEKADNLTGDRVALLSPQGQLTAAETR
ncbi:hypothetical protein ACH5RR_015745, partial [Cinchona calisaya]